MTKLHGYIENPLCFRIIILMHNSQGETNANVAFELGYSTGFQKGKLDLNASLGLPTGTTTAVVCSDVFESKYPADLRQISHTTFVGWLPPYVARSSIGADTLVAVITFAGMVIYSGINAGVRNLVTDSLLC